MIYRRYIVILLYMGTTKEEIYTQEQNEIAQLLKTIAHPARIGIIEYLLKENKCICNDIVGILDLSQPTISNHLKELKLVGIIQGSIEGKTICYCIEYQAFSKISSFIDKFKVEENIKQMCC